MNKKHLFLFFVYTFLFTWFFWGISLLDAREIISLPLNRGYFGIVGAFGPSTVGLIYLVKYKNKSMKEILKNTFVLPKNRWNYFLAFLLMPLLFFITYLFTSIVFDVSYTLSSFDQPYLIPVMYIYILFLGGPLGEEIGWRGYALPELMKHLSPFLAALTLGLIWSFWHLPAFFIPGSSQAPLPFLPYVINTVCLSIIMMILFIKSNKRISSALYFHASANFAVGLFYVIEEIEGVIVYSVLMLSTLAVLIYKNKDFLFSLPTNITSQEKLEEQNTLL